MYTIVKCGAITYRGSNNFLTCGSNLLNVVIERLVGCSLDINSPATIKDLMLTFQCDIKVHDYDFTIENVRYSLNKYNKHRIELLNSDPAIYRPTFKLKNIIGLMVNQPIDYNNTLLPTIYIEQCANYTFENVYTGVRNAGNYKSSYKVFSVIGGGNNVNIAVYNNNPAYFNGKLVMNEPYVPYEVARQAKIGITSIALSNYIEYKGNNTTYYYAIATPLEDNFTTDLSSEQNITVTNNKAPQLVLSNVSYTANKIRIYKGTGSRNYTQYAELTTIDGRIVDYGLGVNGVAWKNTSEPVSTVTANTACQLLKAEKGYNKYYKKYYSNYSPLTNPAYFTNTFTEGDVVEMVRTPFSKFVYTGSEWTQKY